MAYWNFLKQKPSSHPPRRKAKRAAALGAALAALVGAAAAQAPDQHPDRLLWGDTHLHTNLSVDAYFLGNRSADADTAYRFAKGEPVIHPYHRARMQLAEPLDFLAVTDHGELLGVPYRLLDVKDERLTQTRLGQRLKQLAESGRGEDAFGLFVLAINAAGSTESARPPKIGLFDALRYRFLSLVSVVDQRALATRWLASDPTLMEDLDNRDVIMTSWRQNVDAARRHNAPGTFTTLLGWEYTPTPDGANLHRIVLTDADEDAAAALVPFSANQSPKPEDLWAWLAETSAAASADFVSIPHNSNISKGRMFAVADFDGKPMTPELAKLRAHWETVAEVTQIKGTSETHPLLSPDDEFAGFEFFNHLIESREDARHEPTIEKSDYVRTALMAGIEAEGALGVNPLKLGMIGSSDSHSGLPSVEEDNFSGKFAFDSTPETKARTLQNITGWDMSASGLAAVWARENTRKEIIAAFRRRESYGTTGPRIQVRFFGGYGFAPQDAAAPNLAAIGYAKGVPMGGDIERAPQGEPPTFLVRAVKDPRGGNLDRIQIVKGWVGADGAAREKVYDVAWSGERLRGADGKLPPVGDTVDRASARYENTIGAVELAAVWSDPEFDADARAFYYARVLQIPTPRNSLYDAVALGVPHPEGYPAAIQERAYTSPIWYTP